MSKQPRMLVVLAHPDDETFICGGTLAKQAANGWHITLLMATKGEMGRRLGTPPFATRETLPLIREGELREAVGALGIANLRFMNLRDKTLDYYAPQALADQVAAVMRELKPQVVLTFHELIGGHSDHCAIGRATRLAFEQAGAGARLYWLLGRDPEKKIQAVGATPGQITTVEVSGEATLAKVAAYRAHRTQSELNEWLRDDQSAIKQLTGVERFIQATGPVRKGETALAGL